MTRIIKESIVPDVTWITVVVPVGALGAGVRADLLEQALAAGADAIALERRLHRQRSGVSRDRKIQI